jgi:hypothetical protein
VVSEKLREKTLAHCLLGYTLSNMVKSTQQILCINSFNNSSFSTILQLKLLKMQGINLGNIKFTLKKQT